MHPRIQRAREKEIDSNQLNDLAIRAEQYCNQYRYQELYSLIADSEAEFQPLYEISDLIFASEKMSAKIMNLPITNKKIK